MTEEVDNIPALRPLQPGERVISGKACQEDLTPERRNKRAVSSSGAAEDEAGVARRSHFTESQDRGCGLRSLVNR